MDLNFQTFITGLLITSTLTGLITEAFKKIFDEHQKSYHSNTLAGIIDLVISVGVCAAYIIVKDVDFSAKIAVFFVAEMLISWLCSMIGYDKVIQAIGQFKITE